MGKDGVLLCRACSSIRLNVDCRQCGAEAELYRGGACWACVLRHEAQAAFGGLKADATQLAVFIESFAVMKRANSGLTWLRKREIQTLLASLQAMTGQLSHEQLDALHGPAKSIEYIRSLFVEHALLPRRDRYLLAFDAWSDGRENRVENPDARLVFRQFIQWGQLRRLHRAAAQGGGVPLGAFLNAKQTTTVAIEFLNVVCADGGSLADINQHDIDAWFGSGPGTREHAAVFLYWAIKHKHIRRVNVPKRDRYGVIGAGSENRLAALRRILDDEVLPRAVRVASVMIALFAQPVGRTVALRTDALRADANGDLEVLFADDWVPVPAAFAVILDEWVQDRPHLQTAAHVDSPWLFPGVMPGGHIQANTISAAMARYGISPRGLRAAAWRELTRQIPTPLLSGAFGVSTSRLDGYASDAGSRYARYAAIASQPR
ncbi:hypothetical protein RI685_16445 (plasmid) [Clavibacter michiganensis]|uniref:hypothetical protein n=1 Tax=Clavibacter michiganensis TaxID=28447 RepID=UPI003D9FF759